MSIVVCFQVTRRSSSEHSSCNSPVPQGETTRQSPSLHSPQNHCHGWCSWIGKEMAKTRIKLPRSSPHSHCQKAYSHKSRIKKTKLHVHYSLSKEETYNCHQSKDKEFPPHSQPSDVQPIWTLMQAVGAFRKTLARFYSPSRGTTIVMMMTKGRGPARPN